VFGFSVAFADDSLAARMAIAFDRAWGAVSECLGLGLTGKRPVFFSVGGIAADRAIRGTCRESFSMDSAFDECIA
jgi:hypothetical protein